MSFYYIIVFVSLISLTLSQPATICDEARLYTFIPDVRDCSAWFFCGVNGPEHGTCSNDLVFNPETRLCDFRENVDCFQCPSNVGLIEIPMSGSCRSFIRCINGNPFHNICEDGLQFNENTGQCDLPDAVNCRSGFRCPVELPIDGSIVAMRDNHNCSVYHLCIGESEAVRQECNPELHFDAITNLCTFPNSTFCPINQNPGGPGVGPGGPDFETTTIAPTASPTTISTTSTEPTTTETTTEQTSTITETTSTTLEPTTTTTTEPTTTTTEQTSTTTTEATTTTTEATTTTTEATTTTTEPTTTTEQSSTTNEPTTTTEQSSTTNEPTTTTEQSSTTNEPTSTPVFECPFDGVHPHPTECSEYFICAANTPHLMRCADGLHFNSASLQCDFPENAECDLYSNFIY